MRITAIGWKFMLMGAGLSLSLGIGCTPKSGESPVSSEDEEGGDNDGSKDDDDGDKDKSGKANQASNGPGGSGPGGLEIDPNGPPPNALSLVEVSSLVAEATPPALQTGSLAISVGLRSTPRPSKHKRIGYTSIFTVTINDPETECAQGGQYDDLGCDTANPGEEKRACQFIVDVRCRLYHQGPTEIAKWMTELDQQVAGLEAKTAQAYYPCADREAEGFELVTVPTAFTFDAGTPDTIDLGFDYKLNCMQSDSEYSGGFGLEADQNGDITTYYYNGQHGANSAMGSVAKVDHLDNVDFWTTLPGPKAATSYDDLEYSAALIHIRTEAESGKYQMSFTGNGVGPGCGVVVISDGTYMYAKTNQNHDRKCYNTDNDSLPGLDYDVNLTDLEYCLQVDDPGSITAWSLDACTDAGLDFNAVTISYLQQNMIEAFNTPQVFSTAPTGIPAFAAYEPPQGGEGTATGMNGNGQDGMDEDDGMGNAAGGATGN